MTHSVTSCKVMAGQLGELGQGALVAWLLVMGVADVSWVQHEGGQALSTMMVVTALVMGVAEVVTRLMAPAMLKLRDAQAELGRGQALGEDEGLCALLLEHGED